MPHHKRESRFGGVDLLLNNAGLGINSPFESSDPADWKSMIDANLYGVLNCSRPMCSSRRSSCARSSRSLPDPLPRRGRH
ncbi:SDR family NAD(P)-dependent oxidoreductase [Cryobacterium gelidum]|uniref:SDR family NAD(P)-dependent oxidoreductase n=1 Tax=Cryobacterium gelidum TaxID=1259164 RepID=UPI003B97C8EB